MPLLSQIYCVHAEQRNKVLSYLNSYSLVAAAQLNQGLTSAFWSADFWGLLDVNGTLKSTFLLLKSVPAQEIMMFKTFFQTEPFQTEQEIFSRISSPSRQDLPVEMDV